MIGNDFCHRWGRATIADCSSAKVVVEVIVNVGCFKKGKWRLKGY